MSTEQRRIQRKKKEGSGDGESVRRGCGKGRKELPTSFDLQQRSLFPTVPTSGKYATYKKKQQQHVAFKHHVTTVGGILPWQPSHSFPNEVKS